MSDLFFYGTLRHLPLLELVLGRPASKLEFAQATLKDHVVHSVQDQAFPMIIHEEGGLAKGLLLRGLSEEDQNRLVFYEGGFDYDLREQTVDLVDGAKSQALVFYPEPGLWNRAHVWSLQGWLDEWGAMTMLAAQEVMGFYGKIDAELIARSFPSIRTRAWAKLAARQRTTGDARDTANDVIVHDRKPAYVNYFGMEEVALQHRQYDGAMGKVLNRSSLMQGSAVIVLPYDPVRDTVLLVEQFRAPIFLAEDPEPWMWEPVAGMIDPGETPEQAALRESEEEAQIALNRLEYAGGAYSSSGSSTEFLYLYVGLADLTKTIEDGGLATEGEDIRTQILPFSDFLDKVDSHGFKDLPLLAVAHWLARHRERLRG
ncbi:NUDIX domain-containing protein [Ruegeria sp. Alg231-54]|uniref:NUDIX domain-containing protein n=1 Tax=Ruegeria sp. Alg231-54 TaxID=1922221 RepID=UPI000D551EE9|nr:NUDIX domain-containing protein [Ruegeria sp. Alg231-54]